MNLLAKQNLTEQQLLMVSSEMSNKQKSKGIAYALWFVLGCFGGHRFYMGNIGYAVCMLLFGWCTLFIWNFIDVFFVGAGIEKANEKIEFDVITKIKAIS